MSEQESTCPLCEFAGERSQAVYRHLMVSHRKSELCKALLEDGSEVEERSVVRP